MTTARNLLSTLALTGLVSAVVLAFPLSASAEVPTTLAFTGPATVETEFGGAWTIPITVSQEELPWAPSRRVGPNDGTIDVFLSGVGGEFSSDLAIQADGVAYLSQPLDQPLLPAGEYEVSAIYTPAPNSPYDSSQSATTVRLTVTALEATPGVTVVVDAAVSKYPVITASITGAYVEAFAGAPSGTWTFSVVSDGGQTLFAADVAQFNGATEPVRVEIASPLPAGETFSLTSSFAAVDELAGGIVVAPIPNEEFSTPGSSIIDTIAARVAFPWWLVLAIGLLLAGLVATVIVLGVKLSRRGSVPRPEHSPQNRVPGDPDNVELMSWDEAGIPASDDGDEPPASNWLLSDIDPEIDADTESADDKQPTTAARGAQPRKMPNSESVGPSEPQTPTK